MFGERLPELPPSERTADLWQQIGYSGYGINGPEPLTWGEIASFKALALPDLHPAEASVLMDMSRQYVRLRCDTNPLSIEPMERKHV